ncbi:uncharacterized protein LY79DRAFT_137063 [Colletotrichum navitas]|uniref:Uncharacterized protein n=1 Tax=Colletotrichum navitas TaxID=681940 RepID=A0AAD8VBQ9_9PEZI|nr:uncharacterized protein LY79DRAFT_137063 [Colletotrichum navitas]KAK1599271.1 hypothetical protein LY79DRAFT_137063 [Colletotrichum navitas]
MILLPCIFNCGLSLRTCASLRGTALDTYLSPPVWLSFYSSAARRFKSHLVSNLTMLTLTRSRNLAASFLSIHSALQAGQTWRLPV